MREVKSGTGNDSTEVRIIDASTGTPVTSFSAGTAGLSINFRRTRSNPVEITLANLASAGAPYASGGFIHVLSGYYRIDAPASAWASGAADVAFLGSATAPNIIIGSYHPLVRQNPSDPGSAVWSVASRLITGGSATIENASKLAISSTVWSQVTRELTGLTTTQKVEMASTVWANATRELSALTTAQKVEVASTVWANAARTLTAFGFSVTVSAFTAVAKAAMTSTVWAAAARTLTGFTFGVNVSAVTSAAATDVWQASARQLTSLTAAQKVAIASTIWVNATRELTSVRVDSVSSTAATQVWEASARELTSTAASSATVDTVAVASAVWVFATRELTSAIAATATVDEAKVASAVWTRATRELTGITTAQKVEIASTIWVNATRELTDLTTAQKVAITSTVWAAASRTLTEFGFAVAVSTITAAANEALASTVWAAASRTMTSFGFSVTASAFTAAAKAAMSSTIWANAARTLTANTNFNDPTAQTVASVVWDQILTGSIHNITNSAGKRLRLVSEIIQTESAVDDPLGSATTAGFDTDMTDEDGFHNHSLLIFTSGPLTGQGRPIVTYTSVNGRVTFGDLWSSVPANNDTFVVRADHVHPRSEIASSTWNFATRELTDLTTAQKAAITSTVWAAAVRTLTALTAAQNVAISSTVWVNASRTMTEFGFSVEVSALTAAAKAAIASTIWTAGSRTITGTVDMDRIAGSSAAVAKFKAGVSTIVIGTAIGSSTAGSVVTDLSASINTQFVGRTFYPRSGQLDGQAALITGYDGTTKTLAVSALTAAPASGTVFTIA